MTASGLPPLLGAAFPPAGLNARETEALVALDYVAQEVIAPLAADNDRIGRYPTASILALKQIGFLRHVLPKDLGGLDLSHKASMEAQLRLAMADSSVAQLYKVHDEIVREILTYCPPDLKPRLARAIIEDQAIIGLAVAEAGRKVND